MTLAVQESPLVVTATGAPVAMRVAATPAAVPLQVQAAPMLLSAATDPSPVLQVAPQTVALSIDANVVMLQSGEPPWLALQLAVEQPAVTVLTAYLQGPVGPPGPGGGQAVYAFIAAAPVSGHRVVAWHGNEVLHADALTPEHLGRVVGVALHAAAQGETVSVVASGEVVFNGWTFQSGQVWLGADGQLTQTPPAAGFDQVIGQALSATRLFVDIEEPVLRTYG